MDVTQYSNEKLITSGDQIYVGSENRIKYQDYLLTSPQNSNQQQKILSLGYDFHPLESQVFKDLENTQNDTLKMNNSNEQKNISHQIHPKGLQSMPIKNISSIIFQNSGIINDQQSKTESSQPDQIQSQKQPVIQYFFRQNDIIPVIKSNFLQTSAFSNQRLYPRCMALKNATQNRQESLVDAQNIKQSAIFHNISHAKTNDNVKIKRNGGPKIKNLDFYNWEYKMNHATEQAQLMLISPSYKQQSEENKYNNSIENLQSLFQEQTKLKIDNYKSMNWQKGLAQLFVDETQQHKNPPTLKQLQELCKAEQLNEKQDKLIINALPSNNIKRNGVRTLQKLFNKSQIINNGKKIKLSQVPQNILKVEKPFENGHLFSKIIQPPDNSKKLQEQSQYAQNTLFPTSNNSQFKRVFSVGDSRIKDRKIEDDNFKNVKSSFRGSGEIGNFEIVQNRGTMFAKTNRGTIEDISSLSKDIGFSNIEKQKEFADDSDQEEDDDEQMREKFVYSTNPIQKRIQNQRKIQMKTRVFDIQKLIQKVVNDEKAKKQKEEDYYLFNKSLQTTQTNRWSQIQRIRRSEYGNNQNQNQKQDITIQLRRKDFTVDEQNPEGAIQCIDLMVDQKNQKKYLQTERGHQLHHTKKEDPLHMEPQDLIRYMSKRQSRIQEKKTFREKRLVQNTLEQIGQNVQENEKNRIIQNLLQSDSAKGLVKPKFDKSEAVDEEFVRTLADIQTKVKKRDALFTKHEMIDKLMMLDYLDKMNKQAFFIPK